LDLGREKLKTKIVAHLTIVTFLAVIPVYSDVLWRDGHTVERTIPIPLADHPGNVYVDTESVWVKVPPEISATVRSWRMVDDRRRTLGSGVFVEDDSGRPTKIHPGRPGIGWYRIEFLDKDKTCVHWTTAAVLKKLAVETPQDSPVCVDSATSWFAKNNAADQARLSSLAALAGVNWVRDRLTWRELEPKEGCFVDDQTSYDTAATIQRQHGLKVLQVFHSTPDWAWDKSVDGEHPSGRFPRNLLHVYRFSRSMARRYKGRVQAWEPWNEANISNFGGHTVDEMCSYQKAAYLGFKAGDPDVTVGWNVYTTLPTARHTQGLLDNKVWPYFDTYNIHTYEWAHDYMDIWAPARQAACGKPLWLTEADRGLKYIEQEPWHDLSRADEIHKAEYIAQSYASSLGAGSTRHFHFILGHYSEQSNGVQFGLLRKDMTPRPAYVALAAAGRFLAGAKSLGRWVLPEKPDTHIYVFRAWPDGLERDVLVAWAEKKVDWPERGKTRISWSLPDEWNAEGVYDYLGRRLDGVPAELTSAALFVLLPAGQTGTLKLKTAERAALRNDDVCPILLQLQMPRENSMKIAPIPWSQGYEYQVPPEEQFRLRMYAYNFTSGQVKGTVRLENMPSGWSLSPEQWSVQIEPMQRRLLEADLVIPGKQDGTIQISGDFKSLPRSALAFRIHGKPPG